MKQMITQSRLKELLEYDQDNGLFKWKTSNSNRKSAGSIAGGLNGSGYLVIGIDSRLYKAHRLAWLYVHGYFPEQIDHIDHVRTNNKLSNLQASNDVLNRKNMSMHSHNNSGYTGVAFMPSKNKFRARIQVGKKQIHLGMFDSKVFAYEKRKDAERLHGFHINHGV